MILKTFLNKISGKIKQFIAPVYNMHTHKAELYYQGIYNRYIECHLKKNSFILDIGCQYGRFTIPLANAGHRVTATDLHEKYFRYNRAKIKSDAEVDFHKENIDETINNRGRHKFDTVLCLELLYNLPNAAALLPGLKNLLNDEGCLIASHRSLGYYTYRFLKEKKFEQLEKILTQSHPDYNCQTPEQLTSLYKEAGFDILHIHGLGLFSGFATDPFATFADPQYYKKEELQKLKALETDPGLQKLFINNARYLLVIAKPTRPAIFKTPAEK